MRNKILKIDVYGDVKVVFNGIDITKNLSKKSIGMIVYLLNTPSLQASKNTLKDLFWIDAGERAAYNLRYNLWNIKKHIPDIDGEEFIVADGSGCKINSNYPLEKNDVEILEELQDDIEADVLPMILSKGSRMIFMDHFYLKDCDDFNDWLAHERNDREQRIIAVLSKIEEKFEERGELSIALDILNEMMVLSPFEDIFHVKAIKLYTELGQYAEAAREYQSYSKWIKKELGVAPSGSVRDAYLNAVKKSQESNDIVIRIADKPYDKDFQAATEMIRNFFMGVESGIPVEVNNWEGLDNKSKELFETLDREKIITIGR